jgi:hypothetical protein
VNVDINREDGQKLLKEKAMRMRTRARSKRAKIGDHIDARVAARSIRRPTTRSDTAKYALQAIQQANSTVDNHWLEPTAVF